MKKLITVLTTAVIAFALTVPGFAKAPAKGKAQSNTSTTQTTSKRKSHKPHVKKVSKSKPASKGATPDGASK